MSYRKSCRLNIYQSASQSFFTILDYSWEINMKSFALMTFAAALAAPAAWAGDTVTFNSANAPNGTHVQSGTVGCTSDETTLTVSCSSYELAGVGNKDATATLAVTYSGTVLCTNAGGNIVPGQTKYPTISTSTGKMSPKNGRLTVPALTSTTDTATIEQALMGATKCPNLKNWTKSVQPGSMGLVSYHYTLDFTGYKGSYISISD
jgi:hypothetical protein